jgi:hypothetical protein
MRFKVQRSPFRVEGKEQFESPDTLAYKLENGLLKLVESLENKRDRGDGIDHLVVKESNTVYGNEYPILQHSIH